MYTTPIAHYQTNRHRPRAGILRCMATRLVGAILLTMAAHAHAQPVVSVYHRLATFAPAQPNTLVLELHVRNSGDTDLHNIALDASGTEFSASPDVKPLRVEHLRAGEEAVLFWTLDTPVSYGLVDSGAPVFFHGIARTAHDGDISFVAPSALVKDSLVNN